MWAALKAFIKAWLIDKAVEKIEKLKNKFTPEKKL